MKARDRGVVALAGDLVDLVDEDDTPLGLRHVVVGNLQQPREDALDILADIARLGEHRGIDDREGDLQQLGDRPGQQRLARAGGSHQHDVRLVELDVLRLRRIDQALVVVVDRHGHVALGGILSDDVLVEEGLDLRGLEQLLHLQRGRGLPLVGGHEAVVMQDLVTVLDAFVADRGAVHALEHDLHLRAPGAAERAALPVAGRRAVAVFMLCHLCYFSRLESTSSIRPYSLASRADIQQSRSASFSILRSEAPVWAARIS